jgi:hypothetical protein
MLSFASAAFLPDKTMVATYSANLDTLPGATGHPRTMRWWQDQQEAWDACRKDTRPPEEVMPEYRAWVEALPGRPVFVAYPAGFDFTFVNWYLVRFAEESPFLYHAVDIKSYAMAMMKSEFLFTVKRNMPTRWFTQRAHSHIALDDAIEQGELFANMLAENLEK